jgi:hypothetical protein
MQLAENLDLLMLLLLEEKVTATPSLSPETALLSLSLSLKIERICCFRGLFG